MGGGGLGVQPCLWREKNPEVEHQGPRPGPVTSLFRTARWPQAWSRVLSGPALSSSGGAVVSLEASVCSQRVPGKVLLVTIAFGSPAITGK